MSAAESSPDADLQKKIAELDGHVDALKAAIVNARRLRLLIVLAGIAMVVIVVFLFVGLARRITSPEFMDQVAQEAQTRLQDNQQRYVSELQQLVDETAPVVWEAFYDQTKEDAPRYSVAFNRERDAFGETMRQAVDERVTARYAEILNSHEDVIAEEFPQLSDPIKRQELIAALQVAMNELVQKYYVNEFQATLNETYEIWDTFPAVDEPADGGPQLEDRLMQIFTDVVTMVITQLNSQPAAP